VVTAGVYSGSHARGSELLVMDPMFPAERSRYEMVDGLKHPRSVLFHPDGQHILIAEHRNDTLVVLDWVSMRTVEERPVEHRPELLGMLPGGVHAYLSYDGAKRFTRINLATGGLDTVVLPGTPRAWGSSGPVVSRDERYIYVPVGNKDGIAVIALEDFSLVDFIDTPKDVGSLVMNERGDVLFATLGDGHYVARIE
jgi:DNA-binding beta-propeller fold protein YncE